MAKTTLLSLWAITCLIASSFSQESAISFHGGYHEEVVPEDEQDSLHISLRFRSLQDSGVLLIAELQGSQDYLAVLLHSGSQLQVVLSQAGDVSSLGSLTLTNQSDWLDWQGFQLSIADRTLRTELQQKSSLEYTFTAPIQVPRVYFAGLESFFDSRYHSLPLSHYYVGCLANITLNSRAVVPEGMGISGSCCTVPRYDTWCLDSSSFTNLTLTSPHLYPATHSLTVSFRLRLQTSSEGVVISGHTTSTLWTLQLFEGQLEVRVNVSARTEAVICPNTALLMEGWHQIHILLNSSHVECEVDGIVERRVVSVSGFTSSLSSGTLQLGGTSPLTHAPSGRGLSGCFQRLRVNGRDIDVSLLSSDDEEFASDVESPLIRWSEVGHNTTELLVTRGMHQTLTTDNILIELPQDEFSNDLASLFQQELENTIHFEALTRPHYGHLFKGHSASVVEGFTYANILSDDPAQQIRYSHSGQDDQTDVIVFRVWAGCEDTVLAELFQLTLLIAVEEPDEGPVVRITQALHLAVGTRKVLTPAILTVEDSSSPDPVHIQFSVQSVTLQNESCTMCEARMSCGQQCETGGQQEPGIIIKNGFSAKFFNQDEVNRGLVSFQHYERFSTAPLVIQLGVTVQGQGNANIVATIPVTLYQGHINLTSSQSPKCLFVTEGDMALLTPSHLNAVTTFQDQSPVLTYDILTRPLYGLLQRYEASISEWVVIDNSSTSTPAFGASSSSSFTQADLDEGRVRYVQSGPYSPLTAEVEALRFHLRSYNLSGPEGELCINIFPEAFAPQPTINVELSELLVMEDGSTPVNNTVLNSSVHLDDEQYLLMDPDPTIDLQQLEVVFTLVEPPSYGNLELRGQILVAGDNFTYSDVTSNALVYVHGDTEDHSDHFTFYAEAGSTAYMPIRAPNLTSNLTLQITITPVNDHVPVMVVADLESIRPWEGCWISVTPAHINVTDEDRPDEPLEIYIRKKGDTPNGIFAFRDQPDVPRVRFFMQDVLNERVIFVHLPNLSASLNYTQVLRIDDGLHEHIIRRPITISAIPLTLSVSLSLPPDSQCVATIDAAEQPLSVQLNSPSLFTATLQDDFGNNPNKVFDVVVSVVELPAHGQLSLLGEDAAALNRTLTFASHFQFRELHRLQYSLNQNSRNESSDHFQLQFSYGHSVPVLLTLRICLLPALFPLSLQVSPLEVTRGGVAHITTQHLLLMSSREEKKGALLFRVISGPQHGSILNEHSDDMQVSQFSHAEVVTDDIVYESSSSSTHAEDTVVLEVCSALGCLEQATLPISIYPANVTVQNATIRIDEGALHQFSFQDFNISYPPTYTIRLNVHKQPDHGSLFIRLSGSTDIVANYFTPNDINQGRLFYNNSEREHRHDNFEVHVYAQGEGNEEEVLGFVMRIVLNCVNNHPPEAVVASEGLTVVQGSSVLIPSSILSAHDFDVCSEDRDLMWSVPPFLPILGYLYLDSDPGIKRNINWTEGDIQDNRLYYRNTNPTQSVDIILLTVSDGEREVTDHVRVHVVSVAFIRYPNLEDFSLDEGDSKRITYQHLRYFADNHDSLTDSNFLVTITRLPEHGQLSLDGKELLVNDSFSQDQINSSWLEYTHDHSNNFTDSFAINLTVPIRQDAYQDEFTIKIFPVDDDPPVAILSDPMFVVELERVKIDSRIIQIVDTDTITKADKNRVVCQLLQPLTRGRLEKERFGNLNNHTLNFTKFDLESETANLWYRHLSSPDLRPDQLVFNLTDGTNRQPEIYNLTIIVLPQKVPLKLGRLTVTENEMAFLTPEEIMVTHPYLATVGGVIRLKNNSVPLHGDLVTISTSGMITGRGLRSFTSEQLANGSIAYVHNGNESLHDSFQFQYTAREPAHNNRMSDFVTFHIDVTPVNDQPPLIADNMTTLRLWATDTVLLDHTYLSVSDRDSPPSKLNFTFQLENVGGYLALANDTSTHIHWFTQADVLAHRVMFRHYDGPVGRLTYSVTDGDHTATGLISIIADTLALECDTSMWQTIQLQFLGSTNVTSTHLHCTFSDGRSDREVTFRVSNSRVGHFEVDSETKSDFTSTDISAGLVQYVHSETGYWLETEQLSVSVTSSPAVPADNLPLLVRVQYPQPSPHSQLAVNSVLTISEGSTCSIDDSVLDGRNLRYEAWVGLQTLDVAPTDLEILYKVLSGPQHGNLTLRAGPALNFTQRDLAAASLSYTHDDSETLRDTVVLSVCVRYGANLLWGPLEEKLEIAVTPHNDQPPHLVTTTLEKRLVMGFPTSLSVHDLQVVDADTSSDQIHLTLLSLPSNTDLLLNNSVLAPNTTFPQDAINHNWITLDPFSVGTSTFQFVFTDGVVAGVSAEFVLVVEEHTLSLSSVELITYLQNETLGTELTGKHLNTSTNGHRIQTLFTVLHPPTYGRVMMGGAEVQLFTQVDVDQRRVSYVPHRQAQNHRDNFSLLVNNSGLVLSVDMQVRVLAWGQASQTSSISFTLNQQGLVPQPLPPDLLILTELEREIGRPPTIKLLRKPRFGHLDRRIRMSPDIQQVWSNIEDFQFDDLENGLIVYVWDYAESLPNLTVTDSFSVLVWAEDMQPGEATVTLTLTRPPGHTVMPPTPSATPTSHETSNSSVSATTVASNPSTGSGFPVYTLIPIIGIILFLMLLILVVVIFCLSQQKRIKNKWVPAMSHPRHPSPTPWAPQTPQMPLQVTHYDFDPSALPGGENDHHNSDTSSGFSEPECSPRHTPIRSVYSPHPLGPPYHLQHSRSRMRSNVSITFSSRHSATSELSLDDNSMLHSSVSQYAPHRVSTHTPIPLPVRPASHTAFNRPSGPSGLVGLDSGLASLDGRTIERSLPHSLGQEEVQQLDAHKSQQDYSTKQREMVSDWAVGSALSDLSDPNLQRLFRDAKPVLKKEEYWV